MPASDERGLSEFPSASSILATTLLYISNVAPDVASGYDSYKTTAAELGRAILKDISYTQDLMTDAKTIFAAINNLRVLCGTTTPTAQEGANGQLYFKYVTVSNVDTVTNMYWKKDGTWLEVEIGGAGSSTLEDLTDVNITSPTNGQVLGYNSTSQKWENITGGGGGGYPVLYGTTNPASAQGSDGQLYAKYRHSPACFLEVSVYKPIDSTTVSITVTENGTTVYTATPSCTIFGEYSEVTSTITTSTGTYTIKHHGVQTNADEPSQFIEIDGSEVAFTADGQNSSFPIDETKDLAIDYASYVPSCTVSVAVDKPLDSTTVSITITENGNTIYTATPSCTVYGEYSEVTASINTSTGVHTIKHWGVVTMDADIPSQFIKIDGDMISFIADGQNSSFPIDETKSLTVEGGNVVTDMWLKQSAIWMPVKLN